jgi:hypothetical protein
VFIQSLIEGGIFVDIELDYDETVNLFKKGTNDEFLDYLNDVCDYDLYSFSLDWIQNRRYVLKAKGTKGDLVVRWV